MFGFGRISKQEQVERLLNDAERHLFDSSEAKQFPFDSLSNVLKAAKLVKDSPDLKDLNRRVTNMTFKIFPPQSEAKIDCNFDSNSHSVEQLFLDLADHAIFSENEPRVALEVCACAERVLDHTAECSEGMYKEALNVLKGTACDKVEDFDGAMTFHPAFIGKYVQTEESFYNALNKSERPELKAKLFAEYEGMSANSRFEMINNLLSSVPTPMVTDDGVPPSYDASIKNDIHSVLVEFSKSQFLSLSIENFTNAFNILVNTLPASESLSMLNAFAEANELPFDTHRDLLTKISTRAVMGPIPDQDTIDDVQRILFSQINISEQLDDISIRVLAYEMTLLLREDNQEGAFAIADKIFANFKKFNRLEDLEKLIPSPGFILERRILESSQKSAVLFPILEAKDRMNVSYKIISSGILNPSISFSDGAVNRIFGYCKALAGERIDLFARNKSLTTLQDAQAFIILALQTLTLRKDQISDTSILAEIQKVISTTARERGTGEASVFAKTIFEIALRRRTEENLELCNSIVHSSFYPNLATDPEIALTTSLFLVAHPDYSPEDQSPIIALDHVDLDATSPYYAALVLELKVELEHEKGQSIVETSRQLSDIYGLNSSQFSAEQVRTDLVERKNFFSIPTAPPADDFEFQAPSLYPDIQDLHK